MSLPEPLRGPAFGSYAPDEVGWLLTDLSGAELEAPAERREAAIQAGLAHYAESLPVEYQPDEEYRRLFAASLNSGARRVARTVGIVGELIMAERGPGVVLASLARAGTPVGILLRRWLDFAAGAVVPHYTLSIVRGRGIDALALRFLAERHDPRRVVFVDGWTGKGAIARELEAALRAHPAFVPDLAVLADPGSCTRTFGTREDFLVPSACLNSTVSGLVSRTVLNRSLLRPDQFHGAKYYAHLAASDVSATFLDAICACFPAVAEDVARDWPAVRDGRRAPAWTGWREVRRIGARYGITDMNLIKPGVGETTRVLLRRVPRLVLARPDRAADLAHVELLAARRGVPVEYLPGLPYSCVGIIAPAANR
ncbi:MAG: ATP/GTP-binding protein [Jatrophihabitans sp.]|nr:MAG: ATP/GTP-binding protein [Jatrophihabitans sp.]